LVLFNFLLLIKIIRFSIFLTKRSKANENELEQHQESSSTSRSLLKVEINKQLKELFSLQQKRVLISNEFEIGFKEYLLDAPNFNFNKLQTLCQQITNQMNAVSADVIKIRNLFSMDMFAIDRIYKLIEMLQDREQLKLKLVSWIFGNPFFQIILSLKTYSNHYTDIRFLYLRARALRKIVYY
jgi:hypothetical protein